MRKTIAEFLLKLLKLLSFFFNFEKCEKTMFAENWEITKSKKNNWYPSKVKKSKENDNIKATTIIKKEATIILTASTDRSTLQCVRIKVRN